VWILLKQISKTSMGACVNWIHMAQNRDHVRVLVNEVMKFRGSIKGW
jgi:predicted acylesterase/phospholipase RssA